MASHDRGTGPARVVEYRGGKFFPRDGSSSDSPGQQTPSATLEASTKKLSLSSVHNLRANHFEIRIGNYKKLYRYDLTFKEQSDTTKPKPDSGKTKVTSAAKNNNDDPDSQGPPSDNIHRNKKKRIIALLIGELKTDKELAKIPMATDYAQHIITAMPIQEDRVRDVAIDYYHEYRPGPPVPPEVITVTIKLEKEFSLTDLDAHLSGNPIPNSPTFFAYDDKIETVTAMNIIFSYRPYQRCFPRFSSQNPPQPIERSLTTVAGRIFYGVSNTNGPTATGDFIKQGLFDSIPGFTRSVRTVFSSQTNINLNINTKTSLFYRAGNVQQLINLWKAKQVGAQWQQHKQEALLKLLKGVVVRTEHFRGNRQYDNFLATITDIPSVNGHQEPTVSRVDFRMPREQYNGRVSAYFDARHHTQYQANPAVFVVTLGGSTTFPADLLTIIPGQVLRNIKELPKGGVRDPKVNKTEILTRGRPLFHGPAAQGGAPEFDFGLGAEMLSVPVCLLETPKVRYRPRNHGSATRPLGSTAEKGVVEVEKAKYGSWDLRNMSFFKAARPFNWTIIEFTLPGQDQPQCSMTEFNGFKNRLQAEMRRLGMSPQFAQLKVHKRQLPSANMPKHHDVEGPQGLKSQYGIVQSSLQSVPITVNLVVVLLPLKDMELYSAVKRIGDQNLGLPTVCHVLETTDDGLRPNPSPGFPANLSMKINLKADATSVNQALVHKPGILEAGTMILGIDVTHAGAMALSETPSIAAVVGSVDAEFAQWPASLQENQLLTVKGKKKANEEVEGLKMMVVERLKRYRTVNGKLPLRLVVYRDGLSEGQFEMCRTRELPRIEAAVDEVFGQEGEQSGKRIPIVLICAVKRHHTRLFAETAKEQKTDGIIGRGPENKGRYNFNPMPGTMVKDVITYGEGQDFFLISQKALIGTAHPTHYVILHNTTDFSRDEIAQATHDLCFLFGRSSGTVSVCPAAYYADLAADRARCYVRKFYVPAANGTWDPANNRNHELSLTIHPNLREKMFYI
ncbi:hypothetical protein PV11_00346 [Exophiala sideris]|uniref:Piwi domain-containing protein n=1 Tax=Exophiala sideris TaxID=1016849 RepID=A0A0D1ZCT0_9EURO|nr:hypothetical protein PV11_00346 [Exophiala sideris]